jgi:hypothetical protein
MRRLFGLNWACVSRENVGAMMLRSKTEPNDTAKAQSASEGEELMKLGIRAFRYAAIVGAVFVAGFTADKSPVTWQSKGTVVSQAEAVVGRPATPHSAAGHRRRAVRRR